MNLQNYIGNKNISGIYQKIINQIPAHDRYCELFAGSAAIFAQLVKSKTNVLAKDVILNDRSAEVQLLLKKKFPGLTVRNECAISLLQSNVNVWDLLTFIFLDPPYLHSTRSNANLYEFEMTDDDHVQLLTAALKMKCNVMIIHPKCELYDTMLSGWRKIEVKIRYHQKPQSKCFT